MARADLEAAAEEKYPSKAPLNSDGWEYELLAVKRAAYVQGRLDQAEADARIAEAYRSEHFIPGGDWFGGGLAAEIRKGVE